MYVDGRSEDVEHIRFSNRRRNQKFYHFKEVIKDAERLPTDKKEMILKAVDQAVTDNITLLNIKREIRRIKNGK